MSSKVVPASNLPLCSNISHYCIDQADDMVAGEGDFAEYGPQPDQVVDVTELDRSAYSINLFNIHRCQIR